MGLIREERYKNLFFLIRGVRWCSEIVNGFCKWLIFRHLKLQQSRVYWWINVSFTVEVLERLFMGEPMNRECAQWLKGLVFGVRANFHLTST